MRQLPIGPIGGSLPHRGSRNLQPASTPSTAVHSSGSQGHKITFLGDMGTLWSFLVLKCVADPSVWFSAAAQAAIVV